MAEDKSPLTADDAALVNFPYICAYVDVLRVVFHWDASADISVLLEDFEAYVIECPLEADIILPMADLVDVGIDLAFLGSTSRLARPAERVDPAQATTNDPVVPDQIQMELTTMVETDFETVTTKVGGDATKNSTGSTIGGDGAVVSGGEDVGGHRENPSG